MKFLNLCLLALILSGLLILNACNNSNPVTVTACNGMNLCFKMGETQYTMNAKWLTPASRNRVYWEEGSGTNYKNIELDIYGSATGAYTVDTSSTATTRSTFQYYINEGGVSKNIQGMTGTVNLTEITSTTISGNFALTAKDESGIIYEITEGNFVNVPKP